MDQLTRQIKQAGGQMPADVVLRGGCVFDLVTGDMMQADVALSGSQIAGVGRGYVGDVVIDVTGKILVPGFIDTHLHVESSLITPYEFEKCVLPLGVTTAICDPHELANVVGLDGIKWFQTASEQMQMDLRVQLSSCVPATHMETSGAAILAADLAQVMDHPSCIGLAEFMNFPGVIQTDPMVMDKLRLFQGRNIDGHCPQLTGQDLCAYVAAGIRTEHEATTAAEAREKLQRGMRVLIREGSVSKDLHALQPVLTERTSPYMCLCTDDRNPLDIAEYGHLDYMIRTLIALGTPPLAAYRAASLSAAEAFGLKDRGLIAPGLRADIVVLEDLNACAIDRVICAGRMVGDNTNSYPALPPIGAGSVHVPALSPDSFQLRDSDPETDVIGIVEGKIITDWRRCDIAPTGVDKCPDPARDLARITVIERHGKNGNIANGFVQGFHMKTGAIASTVCHDHHNIACVGIDYADMHRAVTRLGELQGGFVVVQNGQILAELALPVAGLMSDQPFGVVRDKLHDLRDAARSLGITLDEPFLQLAFLALPVIPALKITDHGMVDVNAFCVLD